MKKRSGKLLRLRADDDVDDDDDDDDDYDDSDDKQTSGNAWS